MNFLIHLLWFRFRWDNYFLTLALTFTIMRSCQNRWFLCFFLATFILLDRGIIFLVFFFVTTLFIWFFNSIFLCLLRFAFWGRTWWSSSFYFTLFALRFIFWFTFWFAFWFTFRCFWFINCYSLWLRFGIFKKSLCFLNCSLNCWCLMQFFLLWILGLILVIQIIVPFLYNSIHCFSTNYFLFTRLSNIICLNLLWFSC